MRTLPTCRAPSCIVDSKAKSKSCLSGFRMPRAKAQPEPIDLKRAVVNSFLINEEANQLLLENLDEAAWRAEPPIGKGRNIAAIASHMHNVRLMWATMADKSIKLPPKLERSKVSRKEAIGALAKSAAAIQTLVEKGLRDPAGRVPNFKPDVVAFVGYLIAHDSHHRGQISMLARQAGHAISNKTNFGLWEWGSLAKAATAK